MEGIGQLCPAVHRSLMEGISAAQELKDGDDVILQFLFPKMWPGQLNKYLRKRMCALQERSMLSPGNSQHLGEWPHLPLRNGYFGLVWLQTHPVPRKEGKSCHWALCPYCATENILIFTVKVCTETCAHHWAQLNDYAHLQACPTCGSQAACTLE